MYLSELQSYLVVIVSLLFIARIVFQFFRWFLRW